MKELFYRHCERITSSGATIRELDGLRFVALAAVFALHLNHAVLGHPGVEGNLTALGEKAGAAFEFGALGVQLFFLISGFILGLPFARASLAEGRIVPLKGFYIRRLTRLEPPLIIHLTIMLLLYFWVEGKSLAELLPHYAATITYLHSHIYGVASPINPMTWSLEVEAQFYLCTPLLCQVFRVQNIMWRRLILFVAIIGFGFLGGAMPKTLLPVQLPFFLCGFLLVDLYLVEWKSKPETSNWVDVIGLSSVVIFVLICQYHKTIPLVNSLSALTMMIFCWAAFRGPIFRAIFRMRFPATIGGMCYTFYLYHLMVIHAVSLVLAKFLPVTDYLTTYLIYLGFAAVANFLICSVLFVFFERPFMSWRPSRENWWNGLKISANQTGK